MSSRTARSILVRISYVLVLAGWCFPRCSLFVCLDADSGRAGGIVVVAGIARARLVKEYSGDRWIERSVAIMNAGRGRRRHTSTTSTVNSSAAGGSSDEHKFGRDMVTADSWGEGGRGARSEEEPTRMPTTTSIGASDAQAPSKPFSGVSRRKMSQIETETQKNTRAASRHDSRHRDDDDDDAGTAVDIMLIPELETEGEQDITKQIAYAPKVRSSKVQSLHELDSVIGNVGVNLNAPSSFIGGQHSTSFDGTSGLGAQSSRKRSSMSETQLKHEEMERQLASVDLSILTKHLLPSEYVYDEDTDAIWDVTELTEKVRRLIPLRMSVRRLFNFLTCVFAQKKNPHDASYTYSHNALITGLGIVLSEMHFLPY